MHPVETGSCQQDLLTSLPSLPAEGRQPLLLEILGNTYNTQEIDGFWQHLGSNLCSSHLVLLVLPGLSGLSTLSATSCASIADPLLRSAVISRGIGQDPNSSRDQPAQTAQRGPARRSSSFLRLPRRSMSLGQTVPELGRIMCHCRRTKLASLEFEIFTGLTWLCSKCRSTMHWKCAQVPLPFHERQIY